MPSPANANRQPSAPWSGLTDLLSSSSSLVLQRQRTRHPSNSTESGTLPSPPSTPPISPSHDQRQRAASDSPVPASPLRRSISLRGVLRPVQFQSPPPPKKQAGTSAPGAKRRILRWRNPSGSFADPSAAEEEDAMAYVQHGGAALGPAAQIGGSGAGAPQTPQAVYQHILDTTAKRISTLDYLRKSHESRMYWFNTLQFTRPELLRFPCYAPARLARRAHSYLLLGFSLPLILDLGSHATPAEYLRALHALLTEFDQYQAAHPPEGMSSSSSSLSRARIPQMFKRAVAAGGGGGKSRRLTDAGLIPGGGGGSGGAVGAPSGVVGDAAAGGGILGAGATGQAGGAAGSGAVGAAGFGHGHHGAGPAAFPAEPLLPSEQYTHLLTPALPFDPDFFETFATLCDVLIDCYARVTQLVDAPDVCAHTGSGGVGELFAKADAKLRKVIVSGIMREFEDRCRDGIKGEIAGIGKVALGGLM